MPAHRFRDHFSYRFDRAMSAGPAALIGWLGLLTLVIVVAASAFILAAGLGGEGAGFGTVLWQSLMRTIDAGTIAGDSASWPWLATMLAVTVAGIFVFSTLIGILSNGIAAKFEDLRKGRSLVMEKDHTVILGWSEQVFAIVSELCSANASRRKSCIAILAPKDKVEMEDELRERVGKRGRTTIVCRTGSPIDPSDIEVISPREARAIIILAPEAADPDSEVIKSLLALTNSPTRKEGRYHVVAELSRPRSAEIAHLVAGDEVEVVVSGDLTARIAAQTCRQSGLSVVYTELFDFGGCEIYFSSQPLLAGLSYGEALARFEDSALIGLRTREGRVLLNPPMDRRIEEGDSAITISEDDEGIAALAAPTAVADTSAFSNAAPAPVPAERSLILGWNWKAAVLIRELAAYSTPGSSLLVVADTDRALEEAPALSTPRLTVTAKRGDTTDRDLFDGLDLPSYHHVIVLPYADELDEQAADARTLVTLLQLRRVSMESGNRFSIVSEMLDARNRELAEIAHADDFVISDRLVALVMTQISENKDLGAVFTDLLDPEGSEIYLKPASDYVGLGREVSFHTVLEAARRKGETAFGYRLAAKEHEAAEGYGVVLNPHKSGRLAFAEGDRIIVLSEG